MRNNFFDVYLPQKSGDNSHARNKAEQARIFSENLNALESADIVVAVIEGADADSGTAWEMGYAKARGKPVLGLRTDFRRAGQNEQVNLMLEQSSIIVRSKDDLLECLNSLIFQKEKENNKP